jgi:threonine synthase
VVKAFEAGEARTQPWPDARTSAYGLRVPAPLGGFVCLRVLRASQGTAIAIDDADAERGTHELAARAGIDVCPEGGAAWAALHRLRASGFIQPQHTVVVFNTGTGLKYR